MENSNNVNLKNETPEEKPIEFSILEIKENARSRVFEVALTAIFASIGLTFYALGVDTFLAFSVLVLGAIWNFFTQSNKLVACVFGVLVCVPYSYIAINAGLYGHAFLYILFYIPFQFMYYFNERNSKSNEINPKKSLSMNDKFGVITVCILIFFSLSLILLNIESQIYPFFDSLSVVLLILSVFFVSGKYTNYWITRVFAVGIACLLWVNLGAVYGFTEGVAMMSLMYFMYMIDNTYDYFIWVNKHDKNVDKKVKKVKRIKKPKVVNTLATQNVAVSPKTDASGLQKGLKLKEPETKAVSERKKKQELINKKIKEYEEIDKK